MRGGHRDLIHRCERKAREIYRAIRSFPSEVAPALWLRLEERHQRTIAHTFREHGNIRRLFSPDIGNQMSTPLPETAIWSRHSHFTPPSFADTWTHH